MFIKSRQITISIILLLSLCVLLAIFHTIAGPRLVKTSFNDDIITAEVQLHFNNRLEPSKTPEITIQPSRSFETTIQGETVFIRFKDPLEYNTNYSIEIRGVQDTRKKQISAKTSITTKKARYFYLQRNPNGLDTVYKSSLAGEPEKIYELQSIVDYAISASDTLAVIVKDNKTATSARVTINNSILPLPDVEPLQLYGRSDSPNILITAIQPIDLTGSLFVYNTKTKKLNEVLQPDGAKTSVSYVQLARDGKTLVYKLNKDNTLYIDDPFDTVDPLSLGVITQPLRYMPDNSGIFVIKSPNEVGFIDANSGYTKSKEDILSLNYISLTRSQGIEPFYVQHLSKNIDKKYLEQIALQTNDTKVLHEVDTTKSLISRMELSPNDQFILIEQADQPIIYDNTSQNAKPIDVYTNILSTNGEQVHRINGFDVQWGL